VLPLLSIVALVGAGNLTAIAEEDVWRAVKWVVEMKDNQRGPYQGVAWFCNDGTMLPPKSYACRKHGGGIQYGVLGPRARQLAELDIHVGTVLASLEPEDLLADDLYRARCLIVERYLERALDGWVLREAKDYRGFRQIEDEQESARTLLMHVMREPAIYQQRRGLAVRLVRALPYGRNSSLADEIRALAGVIGDEDPAFEELRFKIHAMPEPSDIGGVEAYAAEAKGDLAERASELVAKMRQHYDPIARRERLKAVRGWVRDANVSAAVDAFVATDPKEVVKLVQAGLAVMEAAEATLKPSSGSTVQGERNLLALHVMALVEELWIGITAELSRQPMSRQQAIELALLLTRGARHLGVLSPREQESAAAALERMRSGKADAYVEGLQYARRVLEWGRARQLADLGLPLSRYGQVEPRAWGVIDDILRSGVMLPLATVLDRLTSDAEVMFAGANQLLGAPPGTLAGMRGENPGIAVGPLRVLSPDDDPSSAARHEVVLLTTLPPELPPVAGIITQGAVGSLSHVSLLARNLGIPLAAVSDDVAELLTTWSGRELVLGVSAHRRVILGPSEAVPTARVELLERRRNIDEPFLEVDAGRLDLASRAVLRLDDISERDSGVRVGPKAAELGRLRRLFPERVSDAAVIPFGAFLRHVNRPAADGKPSPMARLRRTYQLARRLSPDKAELLLLADLARFRDAIAAAPFAEGFEAEIDAALAGLGEPGTFGVFVRSDTNVEDLKEFTGAGLNKTVPHRVGRGEILAAIRKVWSSPFTERSYRWRQRILKNPEHVYPSVILHRTVPSEMSGVLVTVDLESGDETALTVSVSEGVAAVVDGGAPETLVLESNGAVRLLTSSRTATRKLIPPLPVQGVERRASEGKDPLLDEAALEELRAVANEVVKAIPPEEGVPWDIEFGFYEGRAYLFQIRPLRASRAPATHPFLTVLDDEAAVLATSVDLAGALD